MASLRVLAFDHEGRPVQFDTWLDDLQLYRLSDSKESVSLFDLASGATTAPPATADSANHSHWLTRDAAACLAIRNYLPLAECAHFGQHMTAQALYDAVVARYSSLASAALGHLLLPYLFLELSAFATVEDLVSHLRASDARYRADAPAEDHFLSLAPTSLSVDLLEQHLLAAETSAVAVGAARGTPRPPFFEGCSPSPLAPSYVSAAAADVSVAEDVGATSASAKRCSSKGQGGKGGGGGSGGGGGGGGGGTGGGSGGSGGGGGGSNGTGGSGGGGTGGGGTGARRVGSGGGQHQQQQRRSETQSPQQLREWFLRGASWELLRSGVAIFDLDFDAILSAMYALSASAEGDYYRCVPPDPGIAAAVLGASESRNLPGTVPVEALHTFTLDSSASRCFFPDRTTLTPLPAPVPVRLADPSGGPVVAHSSTVLPCPADAMVTTTTPGGQRVSICTCTRTGRHLATFTRRPGSNLYSLATEPPQVAASAQVSASGQVAASCSSRLLSHQTRLWHHRLGHPSLPRLCGMHSRRLVSDLPRSLPPLPPSLAPPCIPCVEGRKRAAPNYSSFPLTTAPQQTLHIDMWGPARVTGQSRERYFLLEVDDYTRYTMVFPLRGKGEVGPAPSGVSQVDPLPRPAPVEVAVGSGAASGGAASGGAEPGGAGSEGAGSEGVEPGGEEPGGAEPEGVEPGGPAGASLRLSPQQLREWVVRRARLRSGAPGAGGAGNAGVGGAGVTARASGTRGTAAADPGGARTSGAGAARTGAVGGAKAGDPMEPGAAGAIGSCAAGAVDPGAGGAGGTVRSRPYFVPLLQQRSSGLTERPEPASRPVSPVRTTRRVPRSRPPLVPGTHAMALCPSSVPLRVPLPAPPESSLPEVPDPESDHTRAASPTVSRLLATAVTDPYFESAAASAAASALVAELLDFAAACRLDYATALVAESDSASPPSVGDPDAPDIPTPRSYAEAIMGPYSSQWQAAMDAEMASWKSTGTYVDEVPPPGPNIVDGMWIFRVKRPPDSPPAFKARYVVRGFSQRQGVDYFQNFSPTPKMTTLRSFTAGSLWSLRRPVYDLRQAPREWHDTLRTTLVALGFAPATADPSLFLRTDTSLPPFYVLVYVEDLVFATADTEALTLVKSELRKIHTCTDLGELRSYLGLQITQDRARHTITLTQSHMVHQVLQRFGFQFSSPQPTTLSTSHSLSVPPSEESIETSGLYPELVGCLITSDMGLVIGGQGPVVLTGHADASWVDDSTMQRSSQGYTFNLGSGSVSWQSTSSSSVLSSSCEAEIYDGAMAAQELRWLTFLMTDLGEQPRSPPVLYVDNKAMIALCQEHRLEHRTKHIALRYFLAQELQQRGQLRLAYVATRANTADIFTKALPPGDHQRFSTVLGLVPTLPHLLTA
ncbi:unnamed protein product [Closterium sp. NIES-54]